MIWEPRILLIHLSNASSYNLYEQIALSHRHHSSFYTNSGDDLSQLPQRLLQRELRQQSVSFNCEGGNKNTQMAELGTKSLHQCIPDHEANSVLRRLCSSNSFPILCQRIPRTGTRATIYVSAISNSISLSTALYRVYRINQTRAPTRRDHREMSSRITVYLTRRESDP